jgi:hypothetical protein
MVGTAGWTELGVKAEAGGLCHPFPPCLPALSPQPHTVALGSL